MSADRKYVYFVSYASERGVGNVDVTMTIPITDISHIRKMEKDLSGVNGFVVMVTSYQLMRVEE